MAKDVDTEQGGICGYFRNPPQRGRFSQSTTNTTLIALHVEKKPYQKILETESMCCPEHLPCRIHPALAVVMACESGAMSKFSVTKLCYLSCSDLCPKRMWESNVHQLFSTNGKQFPVPSQESSKLQQHEPIRWQITFVLLPCWGSGVT